MWIDQKSLVRFQATDGGHLPATVTNNKDGYWNIEFKPTIVGKDLF
jgi:hypothetical protein